MELMLPYLGWRYMQGLRDIFEEVGSNTELVGAAEHDEKRFSLIKL